jgi:hypothetical protein
LFFYFEARAIVDDDVDDVDDDECTSTVPGMVLGSIPYLEPRASTIDVVIVAAKNQHTTVS